MERIYYDLHVHSCLSPCGDPDMTPYNIANMALLKGLDLIAVTDHNSCGNGQAVRTAAKKAAKSFGGKELLVLSGFEIETAEEVHVLCLFGLQPEAEAFDRAMMPYYSTVKNPVNIYGSQLYMDHEDRSLGEEERLLALASSISFQRLFHLTSSMGGVFIPAHIDKPVYSVLSNMGFIPKDLPIRTVEVSKIGRGSGFLQEHPEIAEGYGIITSSDAHYLGDLAEPHYYLEAEERTEQAVMGCLISGRIPI